jgi:hypothetical protein
MNPSARFVSSRRLPSPDLPIKDGCFILLSLAGTGDRKILKMKISPSPLAKAG